MIPSKRNAVDSIWHTLMLSSRRLCIIISCAAAFFFFMSTAHPPEHNLTSPWMIIINRFFADKSCRGIQTNFESTSSTLAYFYWQCIPMDTNGYQWIPMDTHSVTVEASPGL